jgi:hypothetical protein
MSFSKLARSRVFLAVVVAVVSTGATLAGTHLAVAGAASTHTITGTVQWRPADADGCDAAPDLEQVTVTDASLRALAHGRVTGKSLRVDSSGDCVSPFRVKDVPDSDSYALQVGTVPLHSAAFERAYLVAEDWILPFVSVPRGGTAVAPSP